MKNWILTALVLSLFLAPLTFASGMINVNTATIEELSQLRNIGPSKAAAIIAYRDDHGPFRSVQELAQVVGIGERTVEINLERIAIE